MTGEISGIVLIAVLAAIAVACLLLAWKLIWLTAPPRRPAKPRDRP
jgi:hypothetical protein